MELDIMFSSKSMPWSNNADASLLNFYNYFKARLRIFPTHHLENKVEALAKSLASVVVEPLHVAAVMKNLGVGELS